MNRRIILHSSLTAVASALFGLVGYRYTLDPVQLPVAEVTIRVDGLPPHLEGFRIGVLTDLHLGPLVAPAEVRKAAERLAGLKPDLVLVAGDLVSVPEAGPFLEEALAPIRGAYAVMGNWDALHHPGVRWSRAVRFLVNQGVLVAPGLWLAGIDDVLYGQPDIGKALAGAPDGAVRLLLAHEPDFADRVRPEHRIALQISGHSHGGQIRLPLVGPTLLPALGRKYHTGLYRAPHCQVYTSRGVGVAHLPLRLWCPPEVTLLRLSASGAGP